MVEVEDPGERPGVPDAFQRLWTPHRMVYIGGQDKPATAGGGGLPVLHASRRGATATP